MHIIIQPYARPPLFEQIKYKVYILRKDMLTKTAVKNDSENIDLNQFILYHLLSYNTD